MTLGFSSNAQDIHFFEENQKDLIKGQIYSINIVDEKSQNMDCTLESNNGSIEKDKTGNYKIQPLKIGVITLTIKNKEGKMLKQRSFKVREILFYAYVRGSERSITDSDSVL